MDKKDNGWDEQNSKGIDDRDFENVSLPESVVNELMDELRTYGLSNKNYRVEDQIATGNMGAIYKAYDMKLRRTSVLKIILPNIKKKAGQVVRFVDEARITGKLEHPNIIPINDIGVLEDDQVFISMKYIQGEQLRLILKNIQDADPEYTSKYTLYSLLTIFRKVCDACAFAHSKGVIHRDIKPENIMVGDYGEVLLVDWGLAKLKDQPEEPVYTKYDRLKLENISATQSQVGAVKGTPAYMSPEQARGLVDKIDRRTDIFLLGTTLYTISTLHEPFSGRDIYEVVTNSENCNFTPPHLKAPERQIPEELGNIIVRAMAKNPDDRYQSVEELCEDIDALMEGRAVSVEKGFKKGEFLMMEGEVGKVAYVILSGRVEVFKIMDDIKIKLVELSDGDCVGEMAMISDAPRSASVIALEDTTVIVITKDLIKRGLDKLPPWMAGVVRALVDRLRAATTNIHPLMSTDCNYHVMNQLRLLFPIMAHPVTDSYTKSLILAMNTGDMINEIGQNLCLMTDRVTIILSKLLEIGILKPFGNDRIIMPNFHLYCQFVDYVAKRQYVKTKIPQTGFPVFFASDSELVMSIQDDDKLDADSDLQEILPYPVEKLIGGKSKEDIDAKFAHFYTKVHGLPNRPPLGGP